MKTQKINPMLSYDIQLNKPKLVNDEAVMVCVNYISNKEKAEVDFDVDELFLDHMMEKGLHKPSQEEVNEFVWDLVKECSEVSDEDLDALSKVMANKRGNKLDNDDDLPMGC